MKILLNLENGYLPDKYGKYADVADKLDGTPVTSFPIKITEIPDDTRFLALYLIDYDATPVCGFPFIHWLAANIPVTDAIPENFSQTAPAAVVQGKNSTASRFIGQTNPAICERYVGPTPPDKDHVYTLVVSAWADKLDLTQGFWFNELIEAPLDALTGMATAKFKSRS